MPSSCQTTPGHINGTGSARALQLPRRRIRITTATADLRSGVAIGRRDLVRICPRAGRMSEIRPDPGHDQAGPYRRIEIDWASNVASVHLEADVDAMGLGWDDLGGGYLRVHKGLFSLYVVELDVAGPS